MCMRPNLCLCKGNKSLGIPTKLAPSCQFTQQQNPQEDAAGVNSEVAAQLSQPQSKSLLESALQCIILEIPCVSFSGIM